MSATIYKLIRWPRLCEILQDGHDYGEKYKMAVMTGKLHTYKMTADKTYIRRLPLVDCRKKARWTKWRR